NALHRRGIKIIAADVDHIVGATENAAGEKWAVGSGQWAARSHSDEVAGAVADERAAEAAEVGEDELANLAHGHGLLAVRLDDLRKIVIFEQRHRARRINRLNGDRADLGHAIVVEDAGAPN